MPIASTSQTFVLPQAHLVCVLAYVSLKNEWEGKKGNEGVQSYAGATRAEWEITGPKLDSKLNKMSKKCFSVAIKTKSNIQLSKDFAT